MHITVPALLGTVEYTVQNLQNVHTWTATNATASLKMEKTAKNKVFRNVTKQTESQHSQQTVTETQLKDTTMGVFQKSKEMNITNGINR